MMLQPPSFFEAPQQQEPHSPPRLQPLSERKSEDSVPLAGTQEELACLKRENRELMRQLQKLLQSAPAHEPSLLLPHSHPHPSTLTPAPALLATDLLQVEAHLQSRVRLLEGEKQDLSSRLLEAERSLFHTREHHQAEIAALRAHHEEALLRLQLENERLSSSYQALEEERETRVRELEEEGEVKVRELEGELGTREERHVAEVEALQARIAELAESHAAVTSDLARERSDRENQVGELRSQLELREGQNEQTRSQLEGRISSLQEELSQSCQRVQVLERYLGGEVPPEGRGVTWREEREGLIARVQGLETENRRLQSESKLLNIRLGSLSEILSIQETDISKTSSAGGSPGSVKSLLTRWREKVFVLLVQQKLQQMEDGRSRHQSKLKEQSLLEQQSQLEREKELLSHTLADRTAELQLQSSKTEEAEQSLEQACCGLRELEARLQESHLRSEWVGSRVREVAEGYGSCKASLDQALSRMANYEHRLALAARRVLTLRASLGCHLALQQGRVGPPAGMMENGTQTEESWNELEPGIDLSSFSREQLAQEVCALTRERDTLAQQLSQSSSAFEQQLQTATERFTGRLSALEDRLSRVQGEKSSLDNQLEELRVQHEGVEGERAELEGRVGKLEGELRDARATLEARIEAAVLEQQQKSSHDLLRMEELVNVARREHAKAVVQLQQLQRQRGREKERVVQAMELKRAQVEGELDVCRKKLQSVTAERNLLMTTLRQEGIVVPSKRPSPRRLQHEDSQGNSNSEDSSESEGLTEDDGTSATPSETNGESTLNSVVSETPPLSPPADDETLFQAADLQDSQMTDDVEEADERRLPFTATADVSVPHESQPQPETNQQDIREVLRDLQLLSASLLENGTITQSPKVHAEP